MNVGDLLPEFVVDSVDPERMKTMAALLRDPNMIHLDPAETARLGMGARVVNQGPINLGYVQTMLARAAGGVDRVRATSFRFEANVHAGDRVVAGGRVTALRPDEGEIDCEVWLDVTGGSRALSGTAILRK
ncbi:MAG: MaoC family dehydratase [Pseudonocardia sp.]|nr:MaoC family dehydratase [Pseudonocardia sp.]